MQDTSFLKLLFNEGLYIFPEEKQNFVSPESGQQVAGQEPPLQAQATPYTPPVVAPAAQTPPLVTPSLPKPAQENAAPAANYLQEGNFRRKVLVLSGWLSLEDKEFLLKILGAVQLSMQDIYLQQHGNATINLPALTQKIQPSYLLAFGVKHQLEPVVPVTEYIPMASAKTTMLFADDLASIGSQVDLKRKLWNNLQQLFTNKA